MTAPTIRRFQPVPAHQAAAESPALGRLVRLVQESSDRLEALRPLLPPMLRNSIKAGPIEGDSWCLLVDNAAAAAKVRQLLPALAARLRTRGYAVQEIRLKIAGR